METPLKAIRRSRGWSQLRLLVELETLGHAQGFPMPSRASLKTQISRWENGHVTPRDPYAGLLAEIYEATPADLGLSNGSSALLLPWATARRASSSTGGTTLELLGWLDDMLGEYTRADNAIGPVHLLSVVAQHVVELESMILSTRGDLRSKVLQLCSRYTEFAGWLCQDSGDLAAAERWTDRALDFLEEVDAGQARAYVLMRKSAIAADRREFARSVSLATAAGREPGELAPHLRALVLRQNAISHALTGNAGDSERAVELALAAVATDELVIKSLAYCTTSYVQMEVGRASFQLRQFDLAADRLRTASASWPAGFERDRGLCLARLALVEAVRGNVDAACEVGKDAVDVAAVAGSARTRSVVRSLDQRLAHHGRLTVVSEFRSYSTKLGLR